MDLAQLRVSDRIIFETIAGSHAYGTAIPTSDKDIRGIYVNPLSDYTGLVEPSDQIGDDNADVVFYSLKKLFKLLMTANPNIIELLWMPDDCVVAHTPVFDELQAHRKDFITQKCYHSHSGYAYAQIKKAVGQNKMVNNPQPKDPPTKEDFCWVIFSGPNTCGGMLEITRFMPMRPVPLKTARWFDDKLLCDPNVHVTPERGGQVFEGPMDLKECRAAQLEHVPNVYRLYRYNPRYYTVKGVFRDGQLVCESIPADEECGHFVGLLIYNEHEYEKALKEWHKYWDWMAERNPERWEKQEHEGLGYDQKNMMHCVRLMLSGKNILTKGEPLVRFTGEDLEYLRAIRAGKLPYDTIMRDVECLKQDMDEAMAETKIPWGVNVPAVDRLYRKLNYYHADTRTGFPPPRSEHES